AGDEVTIASDGVNALPGGLPAGTYYVILASSVTLQLSATPAGPLLDITADGDGTVESTEPTVALYTFDWFESVPSGLDPALPIDKFTNPADWLSLTAATTATNPDYS